jgi:DNA-binding beta-propeller fold protein YncE
MPEHSSPCGIAERNGVIAVSFPYANIVFLIPYEADGVNSNTIVAGTYGVKDGELSRPQGVAFTADGYHVLVADLFNNRVSLFHAVSGAFVAYVATMTDGLLYPRDVLPWDGGTIVVLQPGGVVFIGADGRTLRTVLPHSDHPWSVCKFPSLNGIAIKCLEGNVYLIRDTWLSSSRCAWLSVLCAKGAHKTKIKH